MGWGCTDLVQARAVLRVQRDVLYDGGAHMEQLLFGGARHALARSLGGGHAPVEQRVGAQQHQQPFLGYHGLHGAQHADVEQRGKEHKVDVLRGKRGSMERAGGGQSEQADSVCCLKISRSATQVKLLGD